MFKLLRLAIYALVGYAAYHFIMDLVEGVREPEKPRRAAGQPSRGGGARSASRARAGGGGGTKAVAGARMTATAKAGGEGKREETKNADGGSVRHRVGRGVV